MAFRCSNCNGDTIFDVESQSMKCKHCGSTFAPESFRVKDVSGQEDIPEAGLTVFLCGGCGAELQGTEESNVGFCPYCGGQSVLQKPDNGGETAEYVLPFQVSRDRCAELFREYARGVRYLPKDLKKAENLEKFTGIYMPYYEYDVKMGTPHIRGTKTVEQNRKYDVVNTYQIDAQIEGDYCGVPFDASRYLDDEIAARVLPFDKEKERPFHAAYLAGFYADASTVPPQTYYTDAEQQASQDMVDEVAEQVYRQDRILVEKASSHIPAKTRGHHSTLLPLWFLTWRKGDRVAYAVVNGESGKVVSDMPVDMKGFALGCVIIAAVIFGLLELLFQPTPVLTSVVSIICGALMAVSVRNSTQEIYEKQTHANDKGWRSTEDGTGDNSAAQKKKKARRRFSLPVVIIAIMLLYVVAEIPGLILANDSILILLAAIAAVVVTVFMLVRVLGWQRKIPEKQPMLAMVLIFIGVIVNAAIVVISPVNDGWYYLGDAVSILILIIAAVAMMRAYNIGTTRPLPKLFDRKEVG